MASSSNNPSITSMLKLENGEDVISSLPDSLLVHILSLIPFKYAVTTSILSSRWKLLWTFVPNLEFISLGVSKDNNASLMNFVDRVFLYHNLPCIQQFYLCCRGEIDKSRLNAWIDIAMKRKVRELRLDLDSTFLRLPQSLFTCKTLVKLYLMREHVLDVPELIHFPCLKVLILYLISPSNDLAQRFVNSCPVLEVLGLDGSIDPMERAFNISIPSLKKLYISMEIIPFREFVIDAPVLESLHLINICLTHCVLKIPSSLEIACLCFARPELQAFGRFQATANTFILLKAISNVTRLKLYHQALEELGLANEKDWPIFLNVKHLEVQLRSDFSFKILPILLNKVPRLECLLIMNYQQSERRNQFNWYEPRRSPSYVQTSLKEIAFVIKGFPIDLNPIKYFLGNARVLRKLIIQYEFTTKAIEDEFYDKVVNFPRCSEDCEIIFDDSGGKEPVILGGYGNRRRELAGRGRSGGRGRGRELAGKGQHGGRVLLGIFVVGVLVFRAWEPITALAGGLAEAFVGALRFPLRERRKCD